MNGASKDSLPDLKPINPKGLYTREQIVDPEAGEIVILRPITAGGIRDTERPIRFFSTILVAVGGRTQPLGFEMEGVSSLAEAVEKWAEQAKAAGEKAQEQIRDQQVRSRLQVPAGARLPLN